MAGPGSRHPKEPWISPCTSPQMPRPARSTTRGTCIYSFVLHAPPVALEQIEGALEAQRVTLRSELATLKALVEG